MKVSHYAKVTNNLGEFATAAKTELIKKEGQRDRKYQKACYVFYVPCLVFQGTKEFCDCINLKPKKDCLE